jgi:type I restriction enzyme S subunit
MAGEWRETTLGEVADFLSGGTPSKDRAEYWTGSVPWVSAKDMKQFRLDDTELHVSDDAAANGIKLVPIGSVMLLVRGMTLLNDLPICVVSKPMTFNQDVKALRPKPHVRGDYLPYLLLGNKKRLLSLVDLAGHGTGRLNSDELKALEVVLPPLPEQRTIAHILGTLDDKIELNRRMSETLEAMARALFKSWFVDFDPVRAKSEGRDPGLPRSLADLFPDSFEDSALGEIPKGWAVRRLRDLADLDKGLSYKGEGLVGEGGLPLVNLGCFAGGGRFKAENVKHYRGEYRRRHVVRPGDLVIANTDVTQNRVIIGSPALLPLLAGERQYLFSHHTFAVRFKPDAERWKSYVYFALLRPEFREIAEGYATGTTVLALPRDGVLNYELAMPSDKLLAAFERQVRGLLACGEESVRQNEVLRAIRDALLPKLISGEVRVKDAEKFIGRAA